MKHFSTGLTFILIGFLLLAANFGLFRMSMLFNLFQFWPFIFIFIGLDIMFRQTPLRSVGSTLSTLMLIGLIALQIGARQQLASGGSWVFGPVTVTRDDLEFGSWDMFRGHCELEISEESIDLRRADALNASITFGAGTLNLSADTTNELTLTSHTCEGKTPGISTSDKRDGTHVSITAPRQTWSWIPDSSQSWTLTVPKDLPTELSIDTGASTNDLDLSHIKLTSLDLRTGASDTTLTLGTEADGGTATIDMGAASLLIRIPRTMTLDLKSDSGLSTMDLPADMEKTATGVYQSKDRITTGQTFTITIRSGVSSISIEYTDGDDAVPTDGTSIQYDSIKNGSQSPYPYSGVGPHILVMNSIDSQDETEPLIDLYPSSLYQDHLVLILFQGPKTTGGYAIRTSEIKLDHDILTIHVDTVSPSRTDFVTQAITSPYDLISISKSDLPLTAPLTITMVDQDGAVLDTTTY